METAFIVLFAVAFPVFGVVGLIWIIMHYRTMAHRDRMGISPSMSGEDQEMIGRMVTLLEKMEGRIGTLESILDAEHPRWRDRQRP